jgi:hypothetical protein
VGEIACIRCEDTDTKDMMFTVTDPIEETTKYFDTELCIAIYYAEKSNRKLTTK